MKTRTAWFLLGALVALLIVSAFPARAQTAEIRSLLSDRGWHGVGGAVQVHQPTLEFSPPYIGVWQRGPRSDRYGDWSYVKLLINCQEWRQVPFATLDDDWNFVLIADLTGDDPVARWPEPGTEPYRTMTAVCGLYGYVRLTEAPPLRPNPDGSPYVGSIVRLPRPRP